MPLHTAPTPRTASRLLRQGARRGFDVAPPDAPSSDDDAALLDTRTLTADKAPGRFAAARRLASQLRREAAAERRLERAVAASLVPLVQARVRGALARRAAAERAARVALLRFVSDAVLPRLQAAARGAALRASLAREYELRRGLLRAAVAPALGAVRAVEARAKGEAKGAAAPSAPATPPTPPPTPPSAKTPKGWSAVRALAAKSRKRAAALHWDETVRFVVGPIAAGEEKVEAEEAKVEDEAKVEAEAEAKVEAEVEARALFQYAAKPEVQGKPEEQAKTEEEQVDERETEERVDAAAPAPVEVPEKVDDAPHVATLNVAALRARAAKGGVDVAACATRRDLLLALAPELFEPSKEFLSLVMKGAFERLGFPEAVAAALQARARGRAARRRYAAALEANAAAARLRRRAAKLKRRGSREERKSERKSERVARRSASLEPRRAASLGDEDRKPRRSESLRRSESGLRPSDFRPSDASTSSRWSASSSRRSSSLGPPSPLVSHVVKRSRTLLGVRYELRDATGPLLKAHRAKGSHKFHVAAKSSVVGAVESIPRQTKLRAALQYHLEDRRERAREPVATLLRTSGLWANHDRVALKVVVHGDERLVLKAREPDHFGFTDVAKDSSKNFELVDRDDVVFARLIKIRSDKFKFEVRPEIPLYVAFAAALSHGFGPN